ATPALRTGRAKLRLRLSSANTIAGQWVKAGSGQMRSPETADGLGGIGGRTGGSATTGGVVAGGAASPAITTDPQSSRTRANRERQAADGMGLILTRSRGR